MTRKVKDKTLAIIYGVPTALELESKKAKKKKPRKPLPVELQPDNIAATVENYGRDKFATGGIWQFFGPVVPIQKGCQRIIQVKLPLPPSTNECRAIVNGHFVNTAIAKAYENVARQIIAIRFQEMYGRIDIAEIKARLANLVCGKSKPILASSFEVQLPLNLINRRDLTNFVKFIEDQVVSFSGLDDVYIRHTFAFKYVIAPDQLPGVVYDLWWTGYTVATAQPPTGIETHPKLALAQVPFDFIS